MTRLTSLTARIKGLCAARALTGSETGAEYLDWHICELAIAHYGPHQCWCKLCFNNYGRLLFVQTVLPGVEIHPHETA